MACAQNHACAWRVDGLGKTRKDDLTAAGTLSLDIGRQCRWIATSLGWQSRDSRTILVSTPASLLLARTPEGGRMFPTDRAWCPQGVMVLLQILYRPCCLFWRQLQDDSRAHLLLTSHRSAAQCSVKACRCVAQTASGSSMHRDAVLDTRASHAQSATTGEP